MGSQDESSLAARRARLRGSLAKQALPPDPYSQDPFARAKTPEAEKEHAAAASTAAQPATAAPEAKTTNGNGTHVSGAAAPAAGTNGLNGTTNSHGTTASNGSNGSIGNGNNGAPPPKPSFRLEDLAATQQLKPAVATPGSDFAPAEPISPIAPSAPTQQSPSALSSHMPTSGGGGSGMSSLGSLGLGSLSESLKNLSRNSGNGGSVPASPSALTDIADWSTAPTEAVEVIEVAVEPDIEAFIEAASAASNEMQSADDFQEQFTSLENAASGSVADFFETVQEAQDMHDDPYAHSYPGEIAHSEPDQNAGQNAYQPVAPIDDHDFFATQPATKIESLDDFSNKSAGADKDQSEEESPIEEIIPEPIAPVIAKETKSKRGSKAARAQVSQDEDESTTTASTRDSETVSASFAPTAVAGNQTISLSGLGQMHVIVDEVSEPTKVVIDQPAHVIVDSFAHAHVMETLNNMDQAMGACAMNLSALQASANTQTEALRTLSEILQNQTFSELGMGLSGLMDSLSAALEPMKAVSELVPAIDQLVQVMESKIKAEPDQAEKLSPDQLVMNLADQLSTGAIDPWTFKSAYMAVFPDDHPADLLHRLVDLLGTSRLSGNLFRAAYDAVQAPDPPKRVATFADEGGAVKVVQDESLLKQLDELRQNQNEFERKMSAREGEFADMLNSKEQELVDAQELLNSRWEEFNQRYDELSESLQKRDELIQEKESEINRKDNENGRLRTQMDELKDMVSELQKQFSASKARAEQLSKPGFFDSAPATGANPSLFDAAPAKPLFQGEPQPHQAPPQHQQQQPPQQQAPAPMPQQQQQPAAAMQPQPQPQQAMSAPPQQDMGAGPQGVSAPPQMAPQSPSQQAIPRQNQMTTPFAGAGPGSYGSGVRAQVFEVIVRQALAGAPWREICAGPMQVNNISPDEVESEVKRRQALLKK